MNTRKRHRIISTLKACTWRVLASADTFLISFLLTGSAAIGASIASIEVLTKMVLYYWHERMWEKPKLNLFVMNFYKRIGSYIK
tara:strand:+ start:65444 stop:65695 length:252 start_codon:yes stop_codon:yes gene_type:complete